MCKKLIIILMTLSSVLVADNSFAVFEQPLPMTYTAFLGQNSQDLTYTLWRNSPRDRIDGFLDQPISLPGSGLSIKTVGSSCLTASNTSGRQSCNVIFTYRYSFAAPIVDTPRFSLSANGAVTPLPARGLMSITINVGSSFQIPNAPSAISPAFVGVPVTITYTLTRELVTETISSLAAGASTGLAIIPTGSTCLSAGTDPAIKTCSVLLSYTPLNQNPISLSFALMTASGARLPLAPDMRSFTVTAAPPIAITEIASFAKNDATGPIKGGTGVTVKGTGFDALPADFKLNFVYYDASDKPTAASATSVSLDTVGTEKVITANTPESPIQGSTQEGFAYIEITTAEGAVLNKDDYQDASSRFNYRRPRCQVTGNPSECLALLRPCITLRSASNTPRRVNLKAVKPLPDQCVDSIPKFDPIILPAQNENETYCTVDAANQAISYSFVADRNALGDSPTCQYTTTPPTLGSAQEARLNISYTLEGTSSPEDIITLRLVTQYQIFDIPPDQRRVGDGHCLRNGSLPGLPPATCTGTVLDYVLYPFNEGNTVQILNTNSNIFITPYLLPSVARDLTHIN